MTAQRIARWRVASLWAAHFCRCLSDNCLRIFVILHIAVQGGAIADGSAHQVVPFVVLPYILFAPVHGALANSLPRRWVLVGASCFCLPLPIVLGEWLVNSEVIWFAPGIVGLNYLGTATFSAARYAILPAAARAAGLPLNRLMGWMEMGAAVGIVGGLFLGWFTFDRLGVVAGALLDSSATDAGDSTGVGYLISRLTESRGARLAVVASILNLASAAAAFAARFASDVSRPERGVEALRGFVRDAQRVLRDKEARPTLAMLALFLGILVAGSGAILAWTFHADQTDQPNLIPHVLVFSCLGLAAGSILASVQGHPRRALGLVPLAAFGLTATLLFLSFGSQLVLLAFLAGVMGGLLNTPLRAHFQALTPPDARGNAMSIMNTAVHLSGMCFSIVLFILVRSEVLTVSGQMIVLMCASALLTVFCTRRLFRELLEQIVEVLIWPVYNICAAGPGLKQIQTNGPVILIANHTSWFDPLWVGKVVPRRMIPMMTSRFYDRPLLRWLMKHVAQAIRVQIGKLRRDPPELNQAVAVLDRNECLLVFPEGYMKRKAETVINQFGQGIWRILSLRPQVPVVACWIEGGWGSYFSYAGGPPTVNKSIDWRRQIRIGVSEPLWLDSELLKDQRATRTFLMRACLEARSHLGLEVLPLPDRMAASEPTTDPKSDTATEG